MKTFIKVIEIWIPDKERTRLEFGSGLYGVMAEFQAASEREYFAYDEGLPGKAWALGHPIVLAQFEHSYFKRIVEAKKAGLTCGIAMPIFSGDFLLAVVVFLCGDDEEQAGAIELWTDASTSGEYLTLMDGYYGTLKSFEQASRQITIAKGLGLPGRVWETGMPVLMQDAHLIESAPAHDVDFAGITTGLGIPVMQDNARCYLMTFLSAKATPIAKRIQIWIPDEQRKKLICRQGYSQSSNNLAEIFETTIVKKGEGALGRVWLTGMPSITGNQADNYNPELDNLSSMLAIPVIGQGRLKAVVTFLF